MMGLAEQVAQPQPQEVRQTAPAQGTGGKLPTVQEVVELIMQGVPPEELEAMGIPPEMIVQAIQLIEQQLAQEGQQAPESVAQAPQTAGLAQQLAL